MKKAAAFLLVGILILISLTACAAGGSAGQQAEQPVDQPVKSILCYAIKNRRDCEIALRFNLDLM